MIVRGFGSPEVPIPLTIMKGGELSRGERTGGRLSTALTWENAGAPEGIRTPNLLIRSQVLYPLSYGRPAETASSMLQAGHRSTQNAARPDQADRLASAFPAAEPVHFEERADADDQLGVSLLVTETSGLSMSTSASPPK